eukprot:4790947-Ditylum_brightwellii.AAC.1
MASVKSPHLGKSFSHSTPTPRTSNNHVPTQPPRRVSNPAFTTIEETAPMIANNKKKDHFILRPTAKLELAEGGTVIGLLDEDPNVKTVLRRDVRTDWIDATFGPDFFPSKETQTSAA